MTYSIDFRVRQLIRDNRGTRLHILMVLWAAARPMVPIDIAGEIGCNPDTVQDALRNMLTDGYVAAFGSPGRKCRWWVTGKAQQLPLNGLLLVTKGEKFPLDSTTTTALLDQIEQEAAAVEVAPKGEKLPLDLTAVEKALKSAGVGRNMWAELSALPHVTAACVRAHDKYRRSRGESTGMLITRLRAGDAAPKEEEKTDRQDNVGNKWLRVLRK